MTSLYHTMRKPEIAWSLAKLIRENRSLAATEPRDQIISMLHLASDLNPQDIDFFVDHTSTSKTAYLQKFMRWSIETKKSLCYLSSGFEQADISDPSQPFWTPNVSLWDGLESGARFNMAFRASRDSQLQASFGACSTLSLAGTIIDQISVAGAPFMKKVVNSVV